MIVWLQKLLNLSISPQSYYFTIWILSKIDLLIKNSLFKNVYKEGGLNQGGFWAMTFHAVTVLCFFSKVVFKISPNMGWCERLRESSWNCSVKAETYIFTELLFFIRFFSQWVWLSSMNHRSGAGGTGGPRGPPTPLPDFGSTRRIPPPSQTHTLLCKGVLRGQNWGMVGNGEKLSWSQLKVS